MRETTRSPARLRAAALEVAPGPFRAIRRAVASVLSATTIAASVAQAQWNCPEPVWQAFDPSTASVAGVEARTSIWWDPDGPGIEAPRLVVGGSFVVAADIPANAIATFDPATKEWATLGSGFESGDVRALATHADGTLLVGGAFAKSGVTTLNSLAQWDGASWLPLGSGLNAGGVVHALAARTNGDVIAGGTFSMVGGVSVSRVARWNGVSWDAMGGGMGGGGTLNPVVYSLAAMPNGEIVSGGQFTTAGGVAVKHIARWDGSAWTALGTGVSAPLIPSVLTLHVLPTGDLLAGGDFVSAGGVIVNGIARWNGAGWSGLGSGVSGGSNPTVRAIGSGPMGEVYIGGTFSHAGGTPANSVAHWNGASWEAMDAGVTTFVQSLTGVPDGAIAVGPLIRRAGQVPLKGIAAWDGASWSNLASGANDQVETLLEEPGGGVVAAGRFSTIGGVEARGVARWNGTSWDSLGSGVLGESNTVSALAQMPGGDLIAGGTFTSIGGVNASRIARWDGAAWSPLGAGVGKPGVPWVRALHVLQNGDLIVGGDFDTPGNNIAGWNGAAWYSFGSGLSGSVRTITILPTGALVAGGTMSGNIYTWNGTNWMPLSQETNGSVDALATMPSGDLVAGGAFSIIGGKSIKGVARWDGIAWTGLGAGLAYPGNSVSVYALELLANGDLMVAGKFLSANGQAANHIARWDGANWWPLGEGFSAFPSAYADQKVVALAALSIGDMIAGGPFMTAGGKVTPYLARFGCLSPACYPDCDASGSLDIDDFICFQTLYALGDPKADCDLSGGLDIDDFICFQTAYAIGC